MHRGIELSYDEALAILDLLSMLPYKEVHEVLPLILTRLAEVEEEPRIVTN